MSVRLLRVGEEVDTMHPLMLDLSLLLAGVSVLLVTLFLFRFLDSLVEERKKHPRFLRMSLAIANGVAAAYILSLYRGGTPSIFLILFLDILYMLEYRRLSKDDQGAYHFFGSAVLLNNLTVYILTYSIYRILPLDVFDVGGELFQRLAFVLAHIGCIVLFLIFQTNAFPVKEIKEIIHSKERLLLNIWFPAVSGVLILYSVIVLPMIQTKMMGRLFEISLYAAVFLWTFSCLASSYIIILYQAYRVRIRNSLQDELSQERSQNLVLKEQADRQPLTGLPNRRAWEREVKALLTAGEKGYLVMIDLDHFKDVNDNLGHPEGDRILKETADMLRQTFRKIDIVGHIGGDEFCVFVVGAFEKEVVDRRLEHLMSLRRKDFPRKSGGTFCLSLSAGYAATPTHGEMPGVFVDLVAAADAALYWQKEHGRDGFVMWSQEIGLSGGGRW